MEQKKRHIRLIKKIMPAITPGLAFCAFAVLYTVIFNVSLSYMGNSASNSLSLVLNYLLSYLIIVIVKIIAAYLFLYAALSIFFFYGLKGILTFLKIPAERKKHRISVFFIILLFFLLQLFRSMINYPQMYIDSFYIKNAAYAALQEFLTTYVPPHVFAVLQVLMLMLFTAGIAYELYVKYAAQIVKIIRSKKARIAAGIIILAAGALFITDIILLHRAPAPQKNVIIIASDALRPDHFSGSGYGRDTTPAIDAFMKESLTASDMNTIIPRTFPSWVSILTSQYPQTHSIRNMFPSSANRNREFVTVASVLRSLGYESSVIGDFAADIFPRIDLGFDNVLAPTFNASVLMEQILLKSNIFITPFITNRAGMIVFPSIREFAEFADPSFVVEDIQSQIDKGRRSGKPFFITSFFSVTHFPFSSPWPYYRRYTDPSYTGPSKYLKNRTVSLGSSGSAGENIEAKEIAHVQALYDGCLRGFDDSFARIIAHLEKRGMTQNTVIVLLSDHGENLYEYDNGMGHGEHLRGRWGLTVPFAVKADGLAPAKITKTCSTVDIAPTLFDIMKLPQPSSFEGSSILKPSARTFDAYMETGLWFDTSGDYFFQKNRIYYPDITGFSALEFSYNGEVHVSHEYLNLTNIAKYRAIKKGPHKLIYIPTHNGITYELYNTAKDPDERRNVIATDREAAERMKKIMSGFMAGDSGSVNVNGYIIPLFNEPVF